MSETPDNKPKEATPAAAPAPAPAPAKSGGVPLVLAVILPAVFSAGAAYGGVRAAAGHAPAAHAEAPKREVHPPGPTVALDPFLVAVVDGAKKQHPMKLTVAVEFDATAKEESIKAFMPRIRDAILSHMRTLSYEDAMDSHTEKLRDELLERCRKVGAVNAERILITDLVSQ